MTIEIFCRNPFLNKQILSNGTGIIRMDFKTFLSGLLKEIGKCKELQEIWTLSETNLAKCQQKQVKRYVQLNAEMDGKKLSEVMTADTVFLYIKLLDAKPGYSELDIFNWEVAMNTISESHRTYRKVATRFVMTRGV